MKAKAVDFRSVNNARCIRCQNSETRSTHLNGGLCKDVVSVTDGLPVRCVGKWGQEKVFYLLQYLGIFAQGMKNRWGGNLHYLEICSGPGRLIDYGSGEEFDGSALAILRHQEAQLLKSALFVDINPVVVETLNARIKQLGNFDRLAPLAVQGDYNSQESLEAVLSKKESGGLNLVFLDPTDLSVPFDTVRFLASKLGRFDLLVNIVIGHDFRRNAAQTVLQESFSRARDKYERFLGRPHFMSSPEVFDRLEKNFWSKELSHLFLETYKEQLRSLGFCYFGLRPIEHYYYLLFATRDKKGIEFWEECQKIEFSGQRVLF